MELIREDARFIYSVVDLAQKGKINNNYFLMLTPFLGVFTDGAAKWGHKIKVDPPELDEEERYYYEQTRSASKLYEKSYHELRSLFDQAIAESDTCYYKKWSFLQRILGYYNYGVDIVDDRVCGNTILCSIYNPRSLFKKETRLQLYEISIIAGKIVQYYLSNGEILLFKYNNSIRQKVEDYNIFTKTPLKMKSLDGFILFSIICSINHATYFTERLFIEEMPIKFRLAYLQYYYLSKIIPEINDYTGLRLSYDDSLVNRRLRNCIAHYGLGQYMIDDEIIEHDPMKGMTEKFLNMDYFDAKNKLYGLMRRLVEEIEDAIY